MRAGWRRFVIWAALGLVLAAGLVYAFLPQPIPVDEVVVERGPMIQTVSAEGKTRVRDVFVVSAPVAGRLQRIEAEVGDGVVGGSSTIARIQPSDPSFLDQRSAAEARADVEAAKAGLSLARAELDQARAELDFARSDVVRARALIKSDIISHRALDDAERTFRTRQAAVSTAEAAVRMKVSEVTRAEAHLVSPTGKGDTGGDCPCVTVRAPVDGRILRVIQESEGVVAAGTPLVEIGDPRQLEVVADFLSSDAVRIEPGQRVILEDWGGGAPLNGRVRRIEPYGFTKVSALGIEEQRVNVIVDFTDPRDKWERLGHGYRVEVRVVLWETGDALQVPLTALFRDSGKWAVFAVSDDGRAVLRDVKVGRRNHLYAEILDGLAQGDRIVSHPSDRLSDGVRVEPRPGS